MQDWPGNQSHWEATQQACMWVHLTKNKSKLQEKKARCFFISALIPVCKMPDIKVSNKKKVSKWAAFSLKLKSVSSGFEGNDVILKLRPPGRKTGQASKSHQS